jgi:argininosuccinate lyase
MSKTKLWGGRFSQGTDKLVEEFTESVSYDWNLYRQDIAGSKAHARMLAKVGVIGAEEGEALVEGLDKVLAEIESGAFVWKRELEDVHMNVEQRLTELVGDVGKKLHTARSRNDQVALDFRLYVAERLDVWQELAREVIGVLAGQAEAHQDVILPGYTHLQAAQPVSLAQHLLAYAWMLRRDVERMADAQIRVRVSPLGAAALAGTTHPIEPEFTARELGLPAIFDNSMDAVSDRDFAAESMFAASLGMAHLSRLCEDICIWANSAFGFIVLSDAYSTGSSIMPQKKNPDVAELVRGRAGRVFGALMGLLTTLKGLPMTYNRDLQEDKERLFDTVDTVQQSLTVFAAMLADVKVNAANCERAVSDPLLLATDVADWLVNKGVPFRHAHEVVGKAVAVSEQKGIPLDKLPLAEWKKIHPACDASLKKIFNVREALSRRKMTGAPGRKQVEEQLKRWEKLLK